MKRQRTWRASTRRGAQKARPACHVTSLPPEILTAIFHILHAEVLASSRGHAGDVDEDSEEESNGDLDGVTEVASLSAFPNSISRVCKYWDDILSCVPEFWTDIVVHLDQTYHFELFKTALERSKALDIHSLAILRSDVDRSTKDSLEAKKVRTVLTHLMKLRPIREITCSVIIRTLSADSLPSNIDKAWSSLNNLTIKGRYRGEGTLLPLWPGYSAQKSSFSASLRHLHLVGPVYAALFDNADWCATWRKIDLDSLTISHLRAGDGTGPDIIIFDFFWMQLNSAHSISVLTLVDIDIPYDYEALKHDFSVRNKYKSLSYQRINFKDLPKTFLQPLLYHLGEGRQIPEITFKNCRFHGLGVAHANAVDIVVRGIDNSDSMASFLQGVNPVHLHIIACPGFDDESILAMYPWILFRPEEGAPLPRLKSLEFVDCKNFTIGAIQKVIMARNRRDNTHTPWEQTGEYEDVDGLKLVGSCPEPSVKERQWFRKNLSTFEVFE